MCNVSEFPIHFKVVEVSELEIFFPKGGKVSNQVDGIGIPPGWCFH